MYACENRDREILRLLLKDSRVDVNKGTTDGKTGFMIYFERREMDIASLIVRHSPEMHMVWREMCGRYPCREITSHTFIISHDKLERLLDLWKRLFTYTTIQEGSYWIPAVIERSRSVWKRKISEERWREGCDVMRENDAINVLSLFFCCCTDYSDWYTRNAYVCRDLKDTLYHIIPHSKIEKAFR